MKTNLRFIRKAKGLRQVEIARRVGCSTGQISRFETGDSSIPSNKLPSVAEAYGCSVRDIFDEEYSLDESSMIATVEPADDNSGILKVVGSVSAGIWRERQEWAEDDKYPIAAQTKAFSGYNRAVLMVEGHSMNLVFPAGTALTVVYTDSGVVEPVDNDYVIVQRTLNGLHEITAKKLVILKNGDRELRCESDRPEYLEPVIIRKSDIDGVMGEGAKIIAVVLTAIKVIYRRGDNH